ncbi:MAG: MmcQ/YjbR family DNA-binding protein [Actinomycetota bacterium]|nr:MmcQ/YjbR family DNA-binding protein [Actinomycetota bacterium]
MTIDEARSVALALPEATEEEHHGMQSFRVRGKIFATVPDEDHIRVLVDEADISAAVAEYPDTCAPFYWGARLACVVVTLGAAEPALLRELLTEAWRRKAPKRLAAEFDA